MTAFFMDTSAIIKRYVAEVGSAWITALAALPTGNIVVISRLTIVEGCSVLSRLQRMRQLSNIDSATLRAEFLLHADIEYLTISVPDNILDRARALVEKHPLRTLDAIQLACALQAAFDLGEALTFLSADTNLLNAAIGEGLTTENPLAHQ